MASDSVYTKVRSLLEKTIPASFYDLPSQVRREKWEEVNTAMEINLNTISTDHKDRERGKLIWKLEQLREVNPDAAWIINKVITWVEEGKDFSTIDNKLEDWQMGLSFDDPCWRHCSAVIGLVTADYRASDQRKRDYGIRG